MNKLSLTLMLGAALLVTACGGGDGSGSTDAGNGGNSGGDNGTPTATNEVPGWAFADSAAYTRYTASVQAGTDDSANPVALTSAEAPTSDTDEPAVL